MNNSISFVLVETSLAGNIGAAARAMKTMGFGSLRLVNPSDHLGADAIVRASGAEDILKNAIVYESLADAIADRTQVYGTSARSRTLEWSTVDLADAAELIAQSQIQGSNTGDSNNKRHGLAATAVVFGRERSGLSNQELELCDRRLTIPGNPEFSSLNLGSAVQVVGYELRRALQAAVPVADRVEPVGDALETPVDKQAMELFFAHLETVLTTTGFLDPQNPRLLMRRLRRLFARSEPRQAEMQILRGILTSVEKSLLIGERSKSAEKNTKAD